MANSNVRTRRVSMRQLDLLWEFLNSHKEIATGYNRSSQAKEYSARKWQEIAEILNAQGDGAHKDGKMWSKYWVDYKAKLKKRNAALHSSRRQTGGGPSTEQPLSEIEDKFLSILGEDFGQGVAGIRVDPFPEASASTATIGTVTPLSQPILINEDAVESHVELEVMDVQGTSQEEATDQATLANPLIQEDPEAAEPELAPSPQPSQRRSRHALMSREDARRLLVQSSQERAEAAVRTSNAMEGVQQSLALIANGIMGIREDIQDIKRILSTASPRASE